MEEVTSNFATEEIFPTTHDDYDVENFTYLTQDFFLNSLSFSTDEPVDDDDRYELQGPTKLNMILGVAMVFLIIPTVTGNGLILIAFWKSRRLRTYFNYFICSMAFADLSVGAINMPVSSIQFFSGRWPFGPRACLIFSIIDHIFVHVSVLSVVVIAIDRYKSLADPLLHLRRRVSWSCYYADLSHLPDSHRHVDLVRPLSEARPKRKLLHGKTWRISVQFRHTFFSLLNSPHNLSIRLYCNLQNYLESKCQPYAFGFRSVSVKKKHSWHLVFCSYWWLR